MSPWVFWLFVILLIGSGSSTDVPFVFDETTSGVAGYSSDQIEQASISSPDLAGVPTVTQPADNETLEFPVIGGGSLSEGATEKNVNDLKRELDARVEPDNPRVRDEAVVIALSYPGEISIEQISSIYSYLKNGDDSKKGWGYVSDPRGIDYFMFANQTLINGDRARPPCVGGGDCDDFAILMAALVESVSGTSRIILARNNTTGGHAYAEVYLGQLNDTGNQVEAIIYWLSDKFETDKIFTHIDTDTKDIWLNLDWGPDEKGNAHPGGPFFQGDKHIVLCIRDKYQKTPLKLSSETAVLEDLTPEIKTLLLQEIVVVNNDQIIFHGSRGLAALEGIPGYEDLLPIALNAQKLGLIDINGTHLDIIPTPPMVDQLQTISNYGQDEDLHLWEAIIRYPEAWNSTSIRGNNWHDEVVACMIADLIPSPTEYYAGSW